MLSIAVQTAGPIGLNFFVDTHGSCLRLKKSNLKIIPRATLGPSASNKYFSLYVHPSTCNHNFNNKRIISLS